MATADATKSLVAFELVEEQGNQPSAAEAEKVLDKNVKEEVKDTGFVAMEEIKIIKSYQTATISGSLFIHQSSSYDQEKDIEEGYAFESLFGLRSMPDDDLASISGFETQDSADHVSEEESSISKKVVEAMKSFVPEIVADTLKEQLPSLLFVALKDTLPQLIKDSIKSSVSKSIIEELLQVEAHVQKNLHNQLPNILLKPMYKEFNAFNKLVSQRFVLLQKELSKFLHNKMRKSIRLRVRSGMKEVCHKLSACTFTVATNSQHDQDLMKSEGTVSMKDDSDDDDLDKQPLSRRFKIMTPIPNLIPLNTFVLEHLLKPKEQQKSLNKFTDQLFGTTSLKFSPTPPRDPAKGKEVAISFITLEGTLSQEEFNNQIKELKRKSDLKAKKDKSEQELMKMFNQATLKALAQKWTEHEAKKAKMMEEYNHQISFRAD
ncbi:hypothetical protein Tco_0780072 [Tanacetum coccineum]